MQARIAVVSVMLDAAACWVTGDPLCGRRGRWGDSKTGERLARWRHLHDVRSVLGATARGPAPASRTAACF